MMEQKPEKEPQQDWEWCEPLNGLGLAAGLPAKQEVELKALKVSKRLS
ncbi:hypothetical protein SAMN05444162_4268 [Paenibacillaceae bacterium GAS479]|nr:hypothetical protein SAMN05444162_4268 [Paenibacillaceae bacterium GAS479]